MANRLKPFTNLPLEKFLQSIFVAYARSGITMSLNKVDGSIIKINIDKKMCGG
jgi:hypothetical protein